jgi:transposase
VGDVAKSSKSKGKSKPASQTVRTEQAVPVIDCVRELVKDSLDSAKTSVLMAILERLIRENEQLTLRLAELLRKRHKTEKVSPEQLQLLLAELTKGDPKTAQDEADAKLKEACDEGNAAPDPSAPAPPPARPAVRRKHPNLERVENVIRVPEAERPCPVCGKERTCIGHETSEVVELIPAKVIVREDKREVLACKECDGEVTRAPLGDKVVSGGAYGSNLVSEWVVGKYRDGLPLDRQRRAFEHLGLSLPTSSMSEQIQWATDLLQPLHRLIGKLVLASEVMHIDSTSLPVRDKENGHTITLGALWGCVGVQGEPNGATRLGFYFFTSTGKREAQRPSEIGPIDFLSKRKGPLVADAANIFDVVFKRADITEVGCNMHARRKFAKALDEGDSRAAHALKAFQALYKIEEEIASHSVDERTRIRQLQARPVYNKLIAWCVTYQKHEPPKSPLGQAIRYLLNHQLALTRFIDDGLLPIDNGVVERLHRTPAIGRRNYLFAGSYSGAERAAIAYTIIACCHYADVDPKAYLADILPRLNRDGVVGADLPGMLPAAWKKAQKG